jgi:hypothetical protein
LTLLATLYPTLLLRLNVFLAMLAKPNLELVGIHDSCPPLHAATNTYGERMKYNPDKHHRQSIRLKDYDYTSAGAYFITLCTYQKQHLFGEIVDGEMIVNDAGKIIGEEWSRSAEIRKEIKLDEFVIMPNHIHGVTWIVTQDPSP